MRSTHHRTTCGCAGTSDSKADRASWHEHLGAEPGSHIHQSGDRVGEQIVLVPRVTKEILEAIQDILQERISEVRNVFFQYSSGKLNSDKVDDPWPC